MTVLAAPPHSYLSIPLSIVVLGDYYSFLQLSHFDLTAKVSMA